MENNGWIKLHRKVLDNDIMRDSNAWHIFTWLLLKVDRNTGHKRIGRFWVSEELGMKPSTFYDALQRLVKKYKVISVKGNNKYTDVWIVNWAKYQSVNDDDNNKTTTNQQQDNTLQEVKNKRSEEQPTVGATNENTTTSFINTADDTKTTALQTYGNTDITAVQQYFIEKMGIPEEDGSAKWNRIYWSHLLKNKVTGVKGAESVKSLIDLAVNFKYPRCTNAKMLWNNRIRILSSAKTKRIATATNAKGEVVGRVF